MSVRINWMGEQWLRNFGTKAKRAAEKLAQELLVETKRSISTPYPPASTPGHPPHLRTGKLRGSLYTRVWKGRDGWVATVGSNLNYSYWLEFGTRRMRPRPFLRPALAKIRARIISIIYPEFQSGGGGRRPGRRAA